MTKTEIVERRVPAGLLVECPTKYTGRRSTTGDLLSAYNTKSAWLDTCASRVHAIITWDSQSPLPAK